MLSLYIAGDAKTHLHSTSATKEKDQFVRGLWDGHGTSLMYIYSLKEKFCCGVLGLYEDLYGYEVVTRIISFG